MLGVLVVVAGSTNMAARQQEEWTMRGLSEGGQVIVSSYIFGIFI